jgi:hypothetical protein
MFAPNSRYARAAITTVRTARGDEVTTIRLPVRRRPAVQTVHARTEGQRLDHIAAHLLADGSAFWRLCDASDAIAPDALAAGDVVAIPTNGDGA